MINLSGICPDQTRHKVNINGIGVDIDAFQTRSLCIIGPSGVGKTSLAEAIEERTGRRWRIPPSVVTEPRALRCTDDCSCRPISGDLFDNFEESGKLFFIQRSPVGNVGIETESINDLISNGIGILLILRSHGGIRRIFPDIKIVDLRAPLSVIESRVFIRSQWRPLLTSLSILLTVCAEDMADNENERLVQLGLGSGRWTVINNGMDQAPIAGSVIDRVIEVLDFNGER